jgi:hypothetical protein
MLGGKDAAEEAGASCSLCAVSTPMLLSLVRPDFLIESDDEEDEDDETWSSTCEKAGADEISCFGEDIDEQERAGWREKQKVFFSVDPGEESGGLSSWYAMDLKPGGKAGDPKVYVLMMLLQTRGEQVVGPDEVDISILLVGEPRGERRDRVI